MAAWEYFFALAYGFSVGWLVTSRGESRFVLMVLIVQDSFTKERQKELRTANKIILNSYNQSSWRSDIQLLLLFGGKHMFKV